MEQELGAVVLINEFTVEPEDTDQFLKRWAEDAAIMKRQPGFISAQLHKGVGEFQAKIRDYPPGVVASPHLFQKVAVPRICVD
jgi:heme-degrading monooxygenase HmoA